MEIKIFASGDYDKLCQQVNDYVKKLDEEKRQAIIDLKYEVTRDADGDPFYTIFMALNTFENLMEQMTSDIVEAPIEIEE